MGARPLGAAERPSDRRPRRSTCSATILRSCSGRPTTTRPRPAIGLEGDTAKSRLRYVVGQQLPSWNRSVLDRWVKRAFEKADPSRPTVAHSGVLPHLPQLTGTDSHWYFGWYHGEAHELAELARTVPRTVQFVSEFGAQAVPTSSNVHRRQPLAGPRLGRARRAPRAAEVGVRRACAAGRVRRRSTRWRDATQLYQAHLLRMQIETLRRLKYRPTGGFCFFALNDPSPMVSWSVLDHRAGAEAGLPRGHRRLPAGDGDRRSAAARTSPPATCVSLDVHVVNDTRRVDRRSDDRRRRVVGQRRAPLEVHRRHRTGLGGQGRHVNLSVPDTLGALHFDFRLAFGASDDGPGEVITNGYTTAVTVPPVSAAG